MFLSIQGIFLLVCLAGALAYWSHHSKLRERAVRAAVRHCESQGVQVLDQGAILLSLRPKYLPPCLFDFERVFQFEFSSLGDRRYLGWVTMRGNKVKEVALQPFKDGTFL